ncbi:MAG: Fic family protein [Candidatus Paceibacterota bacterium]|jgi:Fic family protein
MFKPKYNITQKLLSNIKQVAILINELNHKRFSSIVYAEMEQRARSLSVYSSTSIEGNPLALTDVKNLLKNTPKQARDTEKEILNYNEALTYLHTLIKKPVFLNNSLILEIQKIVTKEIIEKYRNGKFRNEPVFVNDPRTRKTIYLPPDSKDVVSLLNDLNTFIKDNEGVTDLLILAGIFHKQFVIIHPFVDGNGRTARLATKILLAKMGLNTFDLFSFENYYNKNVTKYFATVGVFGNYYELNNTDFTSWLEYFTDGIIDELLRVKKEISNKGLALDGKNLKKELGIILDYINKHSSITEAVYKEMTNRARSTRALDFKQLCELKLIKRFGAGKNTYYTLAE